MLPIIVPQTPVVVPAVSSADPFAEQPVEPQRGVSDIILASPLTDTFPPVTADRNALAVPPEVLLPNPLGRSPYRIVDPGVILGIRNSGSPHFVSTLHGQTTVFNIDY